MRQLAGYYWWMGAASWKPERVALVLTWILSRSAPLFSVSREVRSGSTLSRLPAILLGPPSEKSFCAGVPRDLRVLSTYHALRTSAAQGVEAPKIAVQHSERDPVPRQMHQAAVDALRAEPAEFTARLKVCRRRPSRCRVHAMASALSSPEVRTHTCPASPSSGHHARGPPPRRTTRTPWHQVLR